MPETILRFRGNVLIKLWPTKDGRDTHGDRLVGGIYEVGRNSQYLFFFGGGGIFTLNVRVKHVCCCNSRSLVWCHPIAGKHLKNRHKAALVS
jgi:hypothetical protein